MPLNHSIKLIEYYNNQSTNKLASKLMMVYTSLVYKVVYNVKRDEMSILFNFHNKYFIINYNDQT